MAFKLALLENLLDLDVKRRALKLQHMLLEHPYGDYITVELESSTWQDAFSGSNVRLGPNKMDQAVIVMYINDEFDSERAEPYGPKGVRVIMTPTAIFVSRFFDRNNFSVYDDHYLFNGDHFDNAIIDLIMGSFSINSSSKTDSFFNTRLAERAINYSLTFMVGESKGKPIFFRYKCKLTSGQIEADQLILVRTANSAVIIKVLELYVKTPGFSGQPNKETYKSMQELYKAYGVNTLTQLLHKVDEKHGSHKVYLSFEDPASEVKDEIYCEPKGASASWFSGIDRCSIALMEQLT